VDTHVIKFLDGKAPDIYTYSKGYSLTLHTVEVIEEIKPLDSCFTHTHKGQVLQYTTIALKYQKNLRLAVQLDDLIASTSNSVVFDIIDNINSIYKVNWNGCGPILPFRSLRLMEAIKAKELTVKCQDDLFTLVQSLKRRA
ncbi:9985_t:CDS:2, partial [Funneliformis geosporum]